MIFEYCIFLLFIVTGLKIRVKRKIIKSVIVPTLSRCLLINKENDDAATHGEFYFRSSVITILFE